MVRMILNRIEGRGVLYLQGPLHSRAQPAKKERITLKAGELKDVEV